MSRIRFLLSGIGIVLVLGTIALEYLFDRPGLGRIVGWIAIVALLGAVALRVVERRRLRRGHDEPSID